jgi:hypothetical protein
MTYPTDYQDLLGLISLFWHRARFLINILEVLFLSLMYRCLQLERELAEKHQSRISGT